MAEMVAMAEPVRTPKAMQAQMVMTPVAPRMRPTKDLIQSISILEMPLYSMMTPAKM
jgi:hypothetical protein